MSEAAKDDVREAVQRFVGVRNGPYRSFNPVSRAQIWQWCSAMDDRNPRYLPELGPAVAPPAMMQMWTMRDCHFQYAPGSTAAHPFEVLQKLDELGFGANVAVSYDLRFHRELTDGDRVEHDTTIANISERKRTALGEGYFVTEQAAYRDQHGETFAEAVITYFAYRPRVEKQDEADRAETTASGAEARQGGSAISAAEPLTCNRGAAPALIAAGESLPPLTIPVSAKLIVAGALASQDFTPVHHDYHAARDAGMPDIFMNILTTCGLCSRYLTDWSGPDGQLRSLAFRLFAPNTPGDTMTFTGEIASCEALAEARLVTVDLKGSNALGLHVAGRAVLALPAG